MHVDARLGEIPDVRAVGAAVIHVFGIKKIVYLTFQRDVRYILCVLEFSERQGVAQHEVADRIGFELGIGVFGVS